MTGAELTTARKAAGHSREDLAQLLGVNHSTVFRWEKDEMKIPRRSEIAIRAVLQLQINPVALRPIRTA